MPDTALSVRDLTTGYGKVHLLEHVNFDVPRGQILTILGGSGCGKSTLLKHMIGLVPPIAGDILMLGKSIVTTKGEERLELMRHFGVAYQSGALFRGMSVFENVALPLREHLHLPEEEIRKRVKQKLASVNLDGFGDYMPTDLSGGMIKRAAFARAMSMDPEIMFFDEPSAGLDPISSAELDQLILSIRANTNATIIVVTHELASIFTIADRMIMLDRNTRGIIADGDPHELKETAPHPFVRDFLNRNIKTSSAKV